MQYYDFNPAPSSFVIHMIEHWIQFATHFSSLYLYLAKSVAALLDVNIEINVLMAQNYNSNPDPKPFMIHRVKDTST